MAAYDARVVESKWGAFWEKENIYSFKPSSRTKIYSVDTPPPTLSGNMHVGHAFSYSQQDFLVRFFRMYFGGAYYPFGTDDNGLPTERLVERLNAVKSKDMSRSDFVALCEKTIKNITPEFVSDWKRLGISCDYTLSYSTIDERARKISQGSFVELFEKGEVYLHDFPTIWCPECQTSIAQAELEDRELPSQFSTLKFSCGTKELFIATTRPELLGACVAIFVHPKDKRYTPFVGKKARVPLFGQEVPVIADTSATIEKGTGALMVCSYGDKYDVDAIARHKLTPRVIFAKDGTLTLKGYEGFPIKKARKVILSKLKEEGLITEQKDIVHAVNVHDKCGTEIEFLPAEQWFVKILDKKDALMRQGKKITWHPKHMVKRYENWVKGLMWDWNISRERHFGVPIPAWHCRACKEIIVAKKSELPLDPLQVKKLCPRCKEPAEPDTKVLDTWATSSMTPQIISDLVKGRELIPFSLRPQAHDIIRTWAFYTIVKSYLHEKKLPWNDVAISGFVKLKGEKMSKSKGNVVDPRKAMDDFGADALRFWAAGSKLGEDIDYQEKDLVAGKKLVNKLLNASRFVFMNLEGYKGEKPKRFEGTDSLFLKELHQVIDRATKHFLLYEYSKACKEVEQFFWKTFADNYIELVKARIYNEQGDKKVSAQYALYQGLYALVRMFAPFMPFVCEEIYQEHFRSFEKEKSIHLTSWPKDLGFVSQKTNAWGVLEHIISKVRKMKSDNNKSVKAEIILTLEKSVQTTLKDVLDDLRAVVNAKEIKTGRFNVVFVSGE